MKKKIFAVLLLLSFSLVPVLALAQTGSSTTSSSLKNDITGNLKKTGQSASYNTSQEGDAALASLIGSIIKVILGILGVILFALIVYGGYLWMTAGGDSNQVTKAKSVISQAVIGLVIVVAAYTVANYVVTKLTDAVKGTTTTTSTSTKTTP